MRIYSLAEKRVGLQHMYWIG